MLQAVRSFYAWRPRTLSARLARVGVWVLVPYVLIALISPLLFGIGLLPDVNTGLENEINAPPSLQHWCGTNRLGKTCAPRCWRRCGPQGGGAGAHLGLIVGVPLGMLGGYFDGPVDRALVLLMDTVYSCRWCCWRW